jgi:hypothetical protein
MANPEGRPTSYRPEYCNAVIEMGRKGYSVVEMATEVGVARATLEANWPSAHPEFLEALTLARQESQVWWERVGRENLLVPPQAGTFQASMWSRSMSARFPADWREKSETALTGAGGGPVRIVAQPHDEDL